MPCPRRCHAAVRKRHPNGSIETDGLGRLDARDEVARRKERERRHDKRGHIYSKDIPPVDKHRNTLHVVVGRVKAHPAERGLQADKAKAYDVAHDQAPHDDEHGQVDKRRADRRVVGAECFEQADCRRPFKYDDEQPADHRHAGHADHEQQDYPHVDVEQAEPVEDIGIEAFDREGRARRTHGVSGLLDGLGQGGVDVVYPVVVVDLHFEAANLVGAPAVEGGDGLQVGQYQRLVELRQVGLIDGCHFEAARLDGAVEEVGVHAVAHFEAQGVGLLPGDDDAV